MQLAWPSCYMADINGNYWTPLQPKSLKQFIFWPVIFIGTFQVDQIGYKKSSYARTARPPGIHAKPAKKIRW